MTENNEIGVRSKEVDTARVLNTQGKMRKLFEDHNCIAVSLSGGSDSDIMLDLICKVCLNVFGESYRLMDEFHIRKIPILEGLEDDTTK